MGLLGLRLPKALGFRLAKPSYAKLHDNRFCRSTVSTIGPLIIRTRFWGTPQIGIGNYFGSVVLAFVGGGANMS